MSTYIANNHNRESSLFANYFYFTHKEDIIQFDLENIYDTVLVSCPNFLILEDIHLQHNDVKNFFNDLNKATVSLKNTQVIILCSEDYNGIKYINSNIKYISSSSYLLYNEFYSVFEKNNKQNEYMLCNLNCSDLDINNTLSPLLYPNNKNIPVKLINCPSIDHVQNLGIANENETLDLISNCCCYINVDNKYVYDAILMNKPIINLVKNKYLENNNNIIPSCDTGKFCSKEQIEEINQYKISNLLSHYYKNKIK